MRSYVMVRVPLSLSSSYFFERCQQQVHFVIQFSAKWKYFDLWGELFSSADISQFQILFGNLRQKFKIN
jgi:hypothetical protein